MKKLLFTLALVALASPAFAKEFTIKEVSDPSGSKPYYFSPDKLTIQPGDTVTFTNAQEDMHDVMFVEVPKGVDEMIMSPMFEKQGDKFSYTFKVPGTYKFHCHPHEALGMKGELIVGQASKPGETVKMDHHAAGKKAEGKSSSFMDAGSIPGKGKINTIDAANNSVTLTHEPIKQIGWPKMKMQFSVDTSVDLSSFKSGDAISFGLQKKGEDNYVIVKMNKL
ncbi:MAG: copper-binding protein [Ferruginibacter sp.]